MFFNALYLQLTNLWSHAPAMAQVPGHLCPSRWPGDKSWQVEVAVFFCFCVSGNVRSAPEACRHTICPHYTYLTNTPPTCLTLKSQPSSMAKLFSLLRLCYLPARPHKDQETLQALTEPGHEDFFGGGVVERVRQALSFAGQGSEGSAVSWESVWRGTFFIPKVNPCGKRKNRILEQLYHFRSGISCFICAAGLVWCLAWNHGLDFTSFESSLPDRSVPMTLTSGFVWGGPSLSKMQVGTLRANS